jgi:hypothetical protein
MDDKSKDRETLMTQTKKPRGGTTTPPKRAAKPAAKPDAECTKFLKKHGISDDEALAILATFGANPYQVRHSK